MAHCRTGDSGLPNGIKIRFAVRPLQTRNLGRK
jgi:hypothetical protein